MAELNFVTSSEKDTANFGKKLGRLLKPADIICLKGDLGSGKTTLVKGIVQGLGVSLNAVHSPTFTLLNIYDGRLPVYHFDLYRLEDSKQIQAIGYDEFFYGEGVSLIEWADKLRELTPSQFLQISLMHKSDSQRQISVTALGERYKRIVNTIKKPL